MLTALKVQPCRTCRTCRMMKENQKGYDLLVRGRNAAAACSATRIGSIGGEKNCGNLLWQSCRTILKGTKYETLPITVGVLSSVRIPEVLQDVS